MLILGALAVKVAKAAKVAKATTVVVAAKVVVVIATADIRLLRIFGYCGYSAAADIRLLWILGYCGYLGGLRYIEYWGYLGNLFNFLSIIIKDRRLLIKLVRLLEGLKQALLSWVV